MSLSSDGTDSNLATTVLNANRRFPVQQWTMISATIAPQALNPSIPSTLTHSELRFYANQVQVNIISTDGIFPPIAIARAGNFPDGNSNWRQLASVCVCLCHEWLQCKDQTVQGVRAHETRLTLRFCAACCAAFGAWQLCSRFNGHHLRLGSCHHTTRNQSTLLCNRSTAHNCSTPSGHTTESIDAGDNCESHSRTIESHCTCAFQFNNNASRQQCNQCDIQSLIGIIDKW